MTQPIASAFPEDVTVAVITHDSSRSVADVLRSLAADGCPESSILVVDVASRDTTQEVVGEAAPAAAFVALEANNGPNPARNEALRRAPTKYLLLMDGDVMLAPGCTAGMRAAASQPDAAVVAPLVLHADKPDTIQYAGGGLHFICEAVNPWMDRPVAERGMTAGDIGAAPGCALLIDVARALAVGGFDERYFLGKDDGDFLHRIRIAGWRIVETPAARVLHYSRQRSTWLFPYQVRNRWHFLLRNYEVRTLILLAPALALHEVLQFGVLVAKGHAAAWCRGCVGLARMMPALPRDRAAVAAYRRRGDRGLLRDDPLIVRADLASGGGWKRAYDTWLRTYWRLVKPLVRA